MLIGWNGACEITHRIGRGHYAPLGLHVDALSGPGSIGIPGQTTFYWAEVTNIGLWPRALAACDYTTDTLSPGTDLAYGVQRWDSTAGKWDPVSAPDPQTFCQPVPLGRSDTHVRTKWIWPTQTKVVMEFEALGAWDVFRKGDVARFVVFPAVAAPANWEAGIASDSVRIQDEAVRSPVPFRLRH
jgi:hypothetical protein